MQMGMAWQAWTRWSAGWATLLRGWHRWVDSSRVTSNSDRREITGTNEHNTSHTTRTMQQGASGGAVRGVQ